jgi:1,4-alpha-glucan branching enzyme
VIECYPTRRGDQVRVTFRLPLADDDRVSVVGDFNEWNPGANQFRVRDGVGCVSLTLAAGRRYRFRYVTGDGYWFNDQSTAIEDNGYGEHNSILDLPGVISYRAALSLVDPGER